MSHEVMRNHRKVTKQLVTTHSKRANSTFSHRADEVKKAQARQREDRAKVQPPKPETKKPAITVLYPSSQVQYTHVSSGQVGDVRMETPRTSTFERVVMGVALAAAGVAAWIGLNGELRGQTKGEQGKSKTELASSQIAANLPAGSAAKSESKRVAKIEVPEAPKIIGEKTFDVDLKDGVLTFAHVKKGTETVTIDMDIRKRKLNLSPNAEIKQRIYTKSGNGVFLIFESGIFAAFPEPNNIDGKGTVAYTSASDGSRIFNHQGATFLSEDGSVLASTPTALLILNPNNKDVITVTYKTLFGEVPPLVMPIFSQGRDKNHVDLRDEAIKDGDKPLKMTITLDKFRVDVLPDAIAMR